MEQIIICDTVYNWWSSLHHIINGYDESTEKAMYNYDIHRTKMKFIILQNSYAIVSIQLQLMYIMHLINYTEEDFSGGH